MKASVCMASFNREPGMLCRVLDSIVSQKPPFEFEVIVVDDGSAYGAPEVCPKYRVNYVRLEREPVARCASVARNAAYRLAGGEIIIAQSDDVYHETPDAIEQLCRILEENQRTFVIANVVGKKESGEMYMVYSGPHRRERRPYFFLGALWRTDLYAIGGDDEDFTTSGGSNYEDKWFAACLVEGRGLTPYFAEPEEVAGIHQYHETRWSPERTKINGQLYKQKLRHARSTGEWCASGGPWRM